MDGGIASYVNARCDTPHVPSAFITTTFVVPGDPVGEFTRIIPELTTFTFVAGNPPKKTCAPARKLFPLIATGVPPSIGPFDGATTMPEGNGSVTTIPPERMEMSRPRFT